MHTNDTHAHLDNAAQRASLIKQIRSEAKNTLLLDAGDVFSGDLYFTEWKGQADVQLMNFVGYDAMALGNHEFDKGPATLAAFIQNAQFPVVNANYDFTKDASLKGWVQQPITIPDTTHKTKPGIYPYVSKQIDGQLVAIIGVTTEDTAKSSSPGKDIVIHDAFPAVEKTIADINKQGINKIIVISHLGYPRDKEMARQVEGIDVIVGGHTHTKIDKPEIVADDATPTLVVQANEYGKYIGRADLTFDENGVIQTNNVQVKLYPVEKTTPEHPKVKPLLDTYKAQLSSD
ncbi:metallophosphoesterase [Aneurinibacillus soli]|nr:metallophosphoesterase [Aneurinibacillus soli]